MSVQHTKDFQPCVPGAFKGGLTRTLYFDGMVLSETDMTRDQSYWRMKRKLTNRALGHGIVWGLHVDWDPDSRCFTVCPGFGLSCCGDDLIVECPEVVCEGQLIDPCSEDFRRLLANRLDPCGEPCKRADGPVEACLFLEYVECPEDPRRVYEDPCAETAKGCKFGAVRETVRLRLVPPPPPEPLGPIGRFCRSIEEIRAELAKAGVNLPSPALFGGPPELKIGIAHLRDADGTVITSAGVDVALAQTSTGKAILAATSEASAKTRLSVESPPGWFFASVTVAGAESTGLDSLMEFFDDAPANLAGFANRTASVVVAPLFGAGPAHKLLLTLTATMSGTDSVFAVTVTEADLEDPRRDCRALLADPLLFVNDTGCTLKALTLATLYGWFAGTQAPADCGPREDPKTQAEMDKSRAELAWSICWVAWKALYGFDIKEANAAAVQNCLRRLLIEWCDGFHYKGPRCHSNSHGVFLGCVEISPRGRIVCFHEWEHRRHVLTGPLITHWGAQLGLAPLDVVVGRFAQWICCASQARVPTPEAADIPADGGWLSLGDGALAFGKDLSKAQQIKGLKVGSVRPASMGQLIGAALRMITSGREAPLTAATDVDVLYAPGSDMQLLAPRATPARPLLAANGWIRAELAATLNRTPAMAREPMLDLVREMAGVIQLAALNVNADPAAVQPMVTALEGAGVVTLADLAQTGPEAALALARAAAPADAALADPAAEKTMALIYTKALQVLTSAGDAVAKEAADRDAAEPFTRSDLSDAVAGVLSVVDANLKKGALSRKTLNAVADKAKATRP